MQTIGRQVDEFIMFVGFNAIAQGASHKEINKLCQDNGEYILLNAGTQGIAVVADGHGGEKYLRSQRGSKTAIHVAKKAVNNFASKIIKIQTKETNHTDEIEKIVDKALRDLESNIIYMWRTAVLEHVKQSPLTEKQLIFCNERHIDTGTDENLVTLYGTTLIAAFVSETFWFSIQIGDGLCVLIDEECKPAVVIPEDERLAFGRTTSLCDSNAHENFRHSFGFGKIQGITVCTDGVADSFEPDKYLAFNQKLRLEFLANSETTAAELKKFLPELSERGSRDDCAIAGVWRTL